jgi:hypothetical protein
LIPEGIVYARRSMRTGRHDRTATGTLHLDDAVLSCVISLPRLNDQVRRTNTSGVLTEVRCIRFMKLRQRKRLSGS